MSEISDFMNSMPFFTKWWLTLTAAISLLGRFGILKAQHLVLDYGPFIHNFQIWRPITALFFYPISSGTGFHFLINCFFLYNYSLKLETGTYADRPADYCFLLLFNWLSCVLIGLLTEIPVLMDPMVLSVLYIWCQLNQEVIVSFWFGTRFKAMYLPWVLLAFNLIISGGGILELIGILVGHAYFFLMFKYPQDMGGTRFLSTPDFLYRWFPNTTSIHGLGGPQTIRRVNQPDGAGDGVRHRHSWGRGQVLGGN